MSPSVKPAALFFSALVLASFSFGCGQSNDATASTAQPQPSGVSDAPTGRVVEIKVTDKGFEPSSIEAKKGETVSLKFTRTTQSECLKAIAIPSLSIKRDLPMNQAVVVNVPADKEGAIDFQCWMGMVKGKIDVKG